jgi:hypothetical protein
MMETGDDSKIPDDLQHAIFTTVSAYILVISIIFCSQVKTGCQARWTRGVGSGIEDSRQAQDSTSTDCGYVS